MLICLFSVFHLYGIIKPYFSFNLMVENSSNQVSDLNLKISYWYVTHKSQLKKLLVIFLILLNVALFGYSIFRATMILFVQERDYRQLIASLPVDLIDNEYFHQKNKPASLQLLGFSAIRGVENTYDFVAGIGNPNKKWMAQLVVAQLVSGSEVIEQKELFLYPQEEKYVVFFKQKDIDPGSAVIKISEVHWRRVLDFPALAEPKLNFEISEVNFQPATKLGLTGNLPISNLSFKIQNKTAYSYWQVGLVMVLLTSQGTVGGANYFVLDRFLSGETRTVEMRWYEPLPPITDVKIIPEVDIFNAAAYMPVK